MILIESKNLSYLVIFSFFGLVFLIISDFPVQRVGDGSEYYALFYAWRDTVRPWMSPDSFAAYEVFYREESVEGLVPFEWLLNAFPSLRLGDTADFNHFWFYSFLAFVVYKAASFIGISYSAHDSFLLLHYILFIFSFSLIFKEYRWRGVAVAFVLTFLSPILWYFNKVHTEIFTYIFVLLGVVFSFGSKYFTGSFFLALASTQNPSFALIAFVPFFYRITLLYNQKFTFIEVCLAIATAISVLIHPLYYFFRYDVPTPQLLAGGASLASNLSLFYIWIIDPDIGLLPNWPIGFVFILIALLFLIKKRLIINRVVLFNFVFVIIFFCVNLYAHSSTININSGATPGVARYALWYLPIFFPLIYYVFKNINDKKLLSTSIYILIVCYGIFSFAQNNPRKGESYSHPTWLSSLIQSKASGLYDPPPEVFAERYSGVGESVNSFSPWCVLGPDCRKMLINFGIGEKVAVFSPKCFIDKDLLQDFVAKISSGRDHNNPFYFVLGENDAQRVSLNLHPGEYKIGSNHYGNFILGSGWGDPEQWGVWSIGKKVKLRLPHTSRQFYYKLSNFNLKLNLNSFGAQNLIIKLNDDVVYSKKIDGSHLANIFLDLSKIDDSVIKLTIHISNPVSPYALGQSSDMRELGIGLLSFSVGL